MTTALQDWHGLQTRRFAGLLLMGCAQRRAMKTEDTNIITDDTNVVEEEEETSETAMEETNVEAGETVTEEDLAELETKLGEMEFEDLAGLTDE